MGKRFVKYNAFVLVFSMIVVMFSGMSFTTVNAATNITLQKGVNGNIGGLDQTAIAEDPGNAGYYGQGQTTTMYLRDNGNSNALIYFDLALIPANSVIDSATISLFQGSTNYVGGTVSFYRILDPDNKGIWVEGSTSAAYDKNGAAWKRRVGIDNTETTSWTNTAGSTIMNSANATASGAITFTTTNNSWVTSTDISSDIQAMVYGIAVNQGWYLRMLGSGINIQDVASNQNATAANRPKLNITYHAGVAPTTTPTPIASPTPIGTPPNTPTNTPLPTTTPLPTPTAMSLQYPENYNFIEIPDLLSGSNTVYTQPSLAMPAVGQPFFESTFGTILTKATQQGDLTGRHEYSKIDPFNVNKTMVITEAPGGYQNLYRTTTYPYNSAGNFVKQLRISEPRWDPTDPNIIWAVTGFKIVKYNCATDVQTTIKDFALDATIGPLTTSCYRVTNKDEGESSIDKRYWALELQRADDYTMKAIFCYDRLTDAVLGVMTLASNEKSIDWVGMSPLGNYVVVGANWDNAGRIPGLCMADKTLTQFNRLGYETAHADVALDTNGNECIVMQNNRTDYIDLIPLDWSVRPILTNGGSYVGTGTTKLVRLNYSAPNVFNGGVHISCNHAGYALISINEQNLTQTNWLDRKVIIVKLDAANPRGYYLSNTYNTQSSYWEETHGSISNDGTRIVWACNWDQNVGQSICFMLQLDMPQNWEINSTGATSTNTPSATQLPTPTPVATQLPTSTPAATQLPSATPLPTPLPTLGDVNIDGRVNSADALLALQAASGRRTLTNEQKLAADVNLSGTVTSADALMILQFASGRRTHF